MKQKYLSMSFKPDTLALIDTMNGIIREYQAQGYTLTVRQLYYQLVARDHIPNTMQSYKRAASIANDARLSGLMDWAAIEDRTRDFIRRASWSSGGVILESCATQFHMDMWENQTNRVFVIVEKEALAGVLERVCRKFDIPLLAARGYPSASVLREFAKDTLVPTIRDGQDVTILHLGDHDPSGIDMTRDMEERLRMFCRGDGIGGFDIERIALNMDQVEDQQPPPNPAKTTDSRFASYMAQYGDESWELDALTPQYLNELVEEKTQALIDSDAWEERELEIDHIRKRLSKVAEEFDAE